MVYEICFYLVLLIFLLAIAMSEKYTTTQITTIFAVLIGDGGFWAITRATSLGEALLGVKLSYSIGLFVPMLLVMLVCEMYQIKIPALVQVLMYTCQLGLFICVLHIGENSLFYRTVTFTRDSGYSYLTKVYGPMHTVYIIGMVIYMSLIIVMTIVGRRKKVLITGTNVIIMIVIAFMTVVCYGLERMLSLQAELIPIISSVALLIEFLFVTRLNEYNIHNNSDLVAIKLNETACIVVDNFHRFMWRNDKAVDFLPECAAWKPERKIPGDGGRYNTYLRQALVDFTDEEDADPVEGEYEIKGTVFRYRIDGLENRWHRKIGYVIELRDITNVISNRS